MALSNKERQARYRRSLYERTVRSTDPTGRINSVVSQQAWLALEWMAQVQGCSKRAMLEQVILQARAAVVEASRLR